MIADIVGNRTLRSQWDETVKFYSNKIFLMFVSVEDEVTSFTYADFDHRVKQTANFFLNLGIQKGELVALHLHNKPQYMMCWLALAQIGAVSVPLNEHYHLEESSYILKKCNINRIIVESCSLEIYTKNRNLLNLNTVILTDGKTSEPDVLSLENEIEKQSATLKEIRPIYTEDMAVILFTSGTTKYPKGAIYTNCNVVYGGLLHANQIAMNEGDRFLSCMPCYHMDFQEMAAMPVICTGSTLIMVEHYSARRFWSQVYKYKANYTDTMSIMNRTMLLQPVQPWEKNHCLKQIYFSMGLSLEEKEHFEERFAVKLLNSYGMTETVSAVTCAPLFGDKKWPSVGRPALSYEIKIIDRQGNTLPAGEHGEICVHGVPGRSIISGYYQNDEATARLIDKDGWLHSGDWGYLDEDGWLFFEGRCDYMIKRSGENVSSSEVECILTSHPNIVDAAVIGVPDPIRDQAVKAFIETTADLTADEIINYCSERLAKFKVPTIIEFVEDFPRTATGKIKKNLLH